MKKVISMFALVAILGTTVFISCKKGVGNDQNAEVSAKFFKTTAQTKPAVKKLVQYIQQTNKFGDIEKFVKKYGYPNWDKSIVMKKGNVAAREEGEEDYVLAPTVDANSDNDLLGFIASEVSSTTVVCTAYLGTDYKAFAYQSTNPSSVSAEDIVNVMLSLEQDLKGVSAFKITDPLLESFNAIQNGKVPLVQLDDANSSNLGSGCVYKKVINIVDGQQTDLTTWTPLYCTVDQLANFSSTTNFNTSNTDRGYENYQIERLTNGHFITNEQAQTELDATNSMGGYYGYFACIANRRWGIMCANQFNGKCRKAKSCKAVTQLYQDDGDDSQSPDEMRAVIKTVEQDNSVRFIYNLN